MSLLDNLVSAWELNEASGDGVDSHDSNTLTAVNAPTTGAGLVYATQRAFNGTDQYFTINDNASISVDGKSFSFEVWLYVHAYVAAPVVSKWGGGDGEWRLQSSGGANYYAMSTYNGSTVSSVTATNFNFPALDTWHQVIGSFDVGSSTLRIRVNNGTANTAGSSNAAHATTLPLRVAADNDVLTLFDGRQGPFRLWVDRVLTSDDEDQLWNGGAGLPYSSFGGGGGGGGGNTSDCAAVYYHHMIGGNKF